MDEDQAYWTWYGEFLDEDIESARSICRYKGDAVVLPQDDPLNVEWSMWEALYG